LVKLALVKLDRRDRREVGDIWAKGMGATGPSSHECILIQHVSRRIRDADDGHDGSAVALERSVRYTAQQVRFSDGARVEGF
jgi:hypothetical protein